MAIKRWKATAVEIQRALRCQHVPCMRATVCNVWHVCVCCVCAEAVYADLLGMPMRLACCGCYGDVPYAQRRVEDCTAAACMLWCGLIRCCRRGVGLGGTAGGPCGFWLCRCHHQGEYQSCQSELPLTAARIASLSISYPCCARLVVVSSVSVTRGSAWLGCDLGQWLGCDLGQWLGVTGRCGQIWDWKDGTTKAVLQGHAAGVRPSRAAEP